MFDAGGFPVAGAPVVQAPDGSVTIDVGTIAKSAPLTIRQTWNDPAQIESFKGIFANWTISNSHFSSLIVQLQRNGVNFFSVDVNGGIALGTSGQSITVTGSLTASGNIENTIASIRGTGPQVSSTGTYGATSGAFNGTVDTAWSRIAANVWGAGTGAAGSFAGSVKLTNLLAGGGNGSYVQTPSMTVANLAVAATAGNGARAYVTDSTLAFNGTNLGAAVAGGGANHCPVVVVNGAWVIG